MTEAWIHDEDAVFHIGERQIQDRLGVRDELERRGRRAVRGHLPEQHRRFYEALPFLVVAARDVAQRPWATLLTGKPGFVRSPSPFALRIAATPPAQDPLADAFAPGDDLGLLGIDLTRRRRNRANGRVSTRTKHSIGFAVDQTFGNCPRFIQPRDPVLARPSAPGPARRGITLDATQRAWVESAEAFFIASGFRGQGESASYGMDASHRGGPPGFVEVVSERTLRFPDYAGNDHYNTLGNLVLDPRVGLVFVDFEGGGLLQLTGQATVEWETPDQARFPGGTRLVAIEVEAVVEQPGVLPMRWTETDDAR
jgi:predicted pyridoxine 5'-phosphate oxidase superfamily flavin-nucleotide-binding protein